MDHLGHRRSGRLRRSGGLIKLGLQFATLALSLAISSSLVASPFPAIQYSCLPSLFLRSATPSFPRALSAFRTASSARRTIVAILESDRHSPSAHCVTIPPTTSPIGSAAGFAALRLDLGAAGGVSACSALADLIGFFYREARSRT